MAGTQGELRGRVTVRPWRVAQLIDTKSPSSVRAAIEALSVVWGGYFMPIFDRGTSIEGLTRLGRAYDVDSMYVESPDAELDSFLRSGGWSWGYGGPWGPFGDDGGYRKGPILFSSLTSDAAPATSVSWTPEDGHDLFYAATFGAPPHVSDPGVDAGRSGFSVKDLLTGVELRDPRLGVIQDTRIHVRTIDRYDLASFAGIYVIRQDHSEDVVEYWNWRSYGRPLIGVPATGSGALVRFLTRDFMRAVESSHEDIPRLTDVSVWGYSDAAAETASAIANWADGAGLRAHDMPRGFGPRFVFPGLQSRFAGSFRTHFQGGDRSARITLPRLPVREGARSFGLGVVAADVHIEGTSGLDPRLTAAVPPFPRHASTLDHVARDHEVEAVRVSFDGVVLRVSPTVEHARVPFASSLDAIAQLFDDPDVSVSQSDQGKFQTRAAEILGGPFSGVLNQPGVRAAILQAARTPTGVTLNQLVGTVRRNVGSWSDARRLRTSDTNEYARHEVGRLLHSGLFVPLLDVHCSNCRVDAQVSPKDLDSLLRCEFCGQEFRLALSLMLRSPTWRYRLASHLSAEKVQALLPAVATTSLLGELQPRGVGPSVCHVLGLEVKFAGSKPIEIDVAAYLGDPTWSAVMGEVKSSNRIDANDISNLEMAQERLQAKDVPCLILIATLKDNLTATETELLRDHVARSSFFADSFGRYVPRLPLVFVGRDLSMPWDSPEHPWRWGDAAAGLAGTAEQSCIKNLGLKSIAPTQHGVTVEWEDE